MEQKITVQVAFALKKTKPILTITTDDNQPMPISTLY